MKSALRNDVLKVAKTLFLEKGFDAVGMRDIANALGLQPTQVYRLKLSKADILAELIIALNDEQIEALPAIVDALHGSNTFERTCAYLEALYRLDITYLPLRSVGAIYGWSWKQEHEAIVIAQAMQLLGPIAQWMKDDDLDDIPARCYAIWALYYVGYRRAVMRAGTAADCLAEIRPSLALLLRPTP
jgi:AcrR family transcriptional regulator